MTYFLQIGAVFLWTGAYNIIRANSEVTEGDGNSPTTQTKALVSGSTTGVVTEENYPILRDHVDECALPLISNTTTKTKVSFLQVFSTRVIQFIHSFGSTQESRFVYIYRYHCQREQNELYHQFLAQLI
jgi:hypothetical protein